MPAFGRAITAALAARDTLPSPENQALDVRSTRWTEQSSSLPSWLGANSTESDCPWGSRTSQNTNYYQETPHTGVTRYYDWTVAEVPCSPDGYNNTCILVNNQLPGPTIEANWGDWIEVKVTNAISSEGTALHWHGLLQKGTQNMDGVPGTGQCPIAPGSTFTYRFQADMYGTSWWHSHDSSQYGSGCLGPMVIHGPSNVNYDTDLGTVLFSDYYHEFYFAAVEKTLDSVFTGNTSPIPYASNVLLNGHASNTGGSVPSFNFTSGKTYRIRFVNPSAVAVFKISIDGHTMTIFANDFVEVEPYETTVVTIAAGQRTDVLVKANGSPTDAVWMRGYAPPPCSLIQGNDVVQAAIFYENADRSTEPTSTAQADAYSQYCGNDPLNTTVPLLAMALPDPSYTEVIPIVYQPNTTGSLLWYLAGRTAYVDYNDPTLRQAQQGNLDFPYIRNVHNYGTNSSIRLVLENTGNQQHPIHLHGHNIFIVDEGTCGNTTNAATGSCWDGTLTRPSNPQRRDVHNLLPGSYLVIQWIQDNPGIWPLHCHIAWHLSAGFVWTVLEYPEAIEQQTDIAEIFTQTCTAWDAWSNDHLVPQIDDGI